MKVKRKVFYDKAEDIVWVILKSGEEYYFKEVAPGILVEYDRNDKPIGVEIDCRAIEKK